MPTPKDFVTATEGSSEDLSKEQNPFRLPNDGQFLAYYHYLNTTELNQELKKVSRRELCGYTGDEKAKALEARKQDTNAQLIKEISKDSGNSFSILNYIQDIRSLLKMRILVGKKRDAIILLDQKLDIENKKFLEVKREYKECVSALEHFLAYDHQESMRALSQENAEVTRTLELSARRDELSHRCGKVQLEVYQWEEAWRTVKACYRFLHRVSPLGLQDPSPEFSFQDDLLNDDVDVNKSLAGESRRTKELVRVTSLESLIAKFESEASDLAKSQFKSPQDLGLLDVEDIMEAFREIELQNHNALIHLESLGGPMTEMIARMDDAEVSVKQEIDGVLSDIQFLEAEINREEKRALMLEEQSDALIGETFRALIVSQQALQVRILVEDAYESCIAKNESGLDPLVMAEAIENLYEELNIELDNLPRHLVQECEREGFRKELRETREAEEAAFKFELMHRLLHAVKRLMEPSEPKRRPLVKRSVPKEQKIKKNKKIVAAHEMPSANFFKTDCKLINGQQSDNSDEKSKKDDKEYQ